MVHPEAAHEVAIWALDPYRPLPDITFREPTRVCVMTPADVTVQFHGVSDQDAARICREAVLAIVDGRMSPDCDFAAAWVAAIAATVAHYRDGRHPIQ